MRGREFMMKDMYSFSRSDEEFKQFYEICAGAYEKIFDRVGIGAMTYRTIAAGGSFTAGFTDEFQTLSDAGEDIIYIDKKRKRAINKEVYTDENLAKHNFDASELEEKKAIEVGNIFPLGVRYSEALGLLYKDTDGSMKPPVMGSYGLGIGRLIGTVVEVLSDEKGIVWPESVTPFDVHVVLLPDEDGGVRTYANTLYKKLKTKGVAVLYDDRDLRAGEKFADSDLIGISRRVVVSTKTVEAKNLEVVERASGKTEMMTEEVLFQRYT